MTKIAGCLALVLAVLVHRAAAQQGFEQRWPLDARASVRIVNPFGTVRVLGWDAESLAVSARLGRRARVSSSGDSAVRKLWVDVPAHAGDSGRSDLTVHVPREVVLWVKTETAGIQVEGVDGVLDLNSVSGTIHVVGTPRDVTAETLQGDVEIAGGTGRARVKTVSGQVLLRGASADLGASTLSGGIVVRAAGWQRGGTGVQRGKFESVTGDVGFEGELGRGGVVELESQGGKIEIHVPRTTALDFDALTIAGAITNTFNHETPQKMAGESGQELRFSTGVGGGGRSPLAASRERSCWHPSERHPGLRLNPPAAGGIPTATNATGGCHALSTSQSHARDTGKRRPHRSGARVVGAPVDLDRASRQPVR